MGDKWGEVGRELGVGGKHSQCSERAAGGGVGGSLILESEGRRVIGGGFGERPHAPGGQQ